MSDTVILIFLLFVILNLRICNLLYNALFHDS